MVLGNSMFCPLERDSTPKPQNRAEARTMSPCSASLPMRETGPRLIRGLKYTRSTLPQFFVMWNQEGGICRLLCFAVLFIHRVFMGAMSVLAECTLRL